MIPCENDQLVPRFDPDLHVLHFIFKLEEKCEIILRKDVIINNNPFWKHVSINIKYM